MPQLEMFSSDDVDKIPDGEEPNSMDIDFELEDELPLSVLVKAKARKHLRTSLDSDGSDFEAVVKKKPRLIDCEEQHQEQEQETTEDRWKKYLDSSLMASNYFTEDDQGYEPGFEAYHSSEAINITTEMPIEIEKAVSEEKGQSSSFPEELEKSEQASEENLTSHTTTEKEENSSSETTNMATGKFVCSENNPSSSFQEELEIRTTPMEEKTNAKNNDVSSHTMDHSYMSSNISYSDEVFVEIIDSDDENKENLLSSFTSKTDNDDEKKVMVKIELETDTKPENLPLQCVPQDFYINEMKQLQEIKFEIQDAEKLLATVYKTAPDGGHMLFNYIDRLREQLEIKAKYIVGLYTKEPLQSNSSNSSNTNNSVDQKPSLLLKELHDFENNQKLSGNVPLYQRKNKNFIKTCKEDKDDKVIDGDKYDHGMDMFNAEHIPSWDRLFQGITNMCPKHMTEKSLTTFRVQKEVTLEKLKELHGSLENRPEETVLEADPDGLMPNIVLMKHQKHALAWMKWRESNQKPSGGILADDMGLGKTLTMISLILDCKNREDTQDLDNVDTTHGTLVVCPAIVTRQWEAEVKSKVQDSRLTCHVHHGSNRTRKSKFFLNFDIVITSYDIVSRENTYKGPLFGINWKRVILDEAHVVRNHKTKRSEGTHDLKAKYRWALTGTPVHNKDLDIYGLLKFLRCAPFDDINYWTFWLTKYKSQSGYERLTCIMKTLMLRRTKVLLMERGELWLPIKNIEIVELQINEQEREVYQKYLSYSQTLFSQFLEQQEKRNAERAQAFLRVYEKQREEGQIKLVYILVLLLRLRQLCCHPNLSKAMLEDDQMLDIIAECEQALNVQTSTDDEVPKDPVLQYDNPVFHEDYKSTKILKAMEIFLKIPTNEKVIIVSQWTKFLNLIRPYIADEGYEVMELTGKTPLMDRQEIIDTFNDPKSSKRVLLLSLTAGGVGLNLMGANHLILMDLHWNPQQEAQAQDRIYRVGQKKDVHIYKLICMDTIEERIKKLQDDKLELADMLTGVKACQVARLTIQDLRMLFEM